MIVNLAVNSLCFLSISTLLTFCSAVKTTKPNASPKTSPNTKTLPRQVTPIAQMDFLVTPDDFKHDEDVLYLLNQLHRPQSIEKFYRSAAQLYADLAVAYQEVQADAKVAERFLNIMKRLTTASLKEPLSVTNIIFAASKHLRPLFKHKSPPIEEIHHTIANLERDKSRKMIWLMTQFFLSFTLREVSQIQDFIRVVSLATLNNSEQATPAAKKGQLDISRTSLESYAERIRLTIANALAKMLILLDLFVTDPTVITRSINLVNRLWSLHLHRLAQRENIPFDQIDDKWKDPILYRKSAIHFTFEDWSPDSFSPEAMAELRRAAESEELLDNAALAQQSSSSLLSPTLCITAVIIAILSACTAVYVYLKRRQNLRQPQIDLTSLESQSINEIVSKLESNIE